RLDWSPPDSSGGVAITGYRIFRGGASGALNKLTETSGRAHSYTDQTAANGITYYYSVQAINSKGAGAFSREVVVTPSAAYSSTNGALKPTEPICVLPLKNSRPTSQEN
ncbi:MAG: fibronectin type III domain-containing protein, partial [Candidatus Yanofskybacteria bacterium]|nr:fibronectin type III domain-containing protein [Candidatus Yanofskybacteria bacterium]